MDVLTTWAVANPAVARLLCVLVLVLATFLVWLFFCCYSWNQSSSPSLERYLAGRSASVPTLLAMASDRLTSGQMLLTVSFKSDLLSLSPPPSVQ